MKELTDSRLKIAKEVTKDELINKIKTSDPTRFDQMLIETEERKTYYYVKYNSVAFTRKPKTLKFPLFKDLVNDFEKNIENSGEVTILVNDSIIQKIKTKGKEPVDTPKYTGKNLIFNELKIVIENDKVKLKQPIYYIPSETERCSCNTCKGEMYTTCTETECRGQHIYDCSKCRTAGKTDCVDCDAIGEYSCPSCKGKGTLVCSGCGGKPRVHCRRCTGNGYTNDGKRCPNRCDKGWTECSDCKGSGERKCSSVNTSGGVVGLGLGNLVAAGIKKTAGNEYCGGTGIIRCATCSATGKITCDKCEGNGRIECKTCYDDHQDNRFGKVDCRTCETAGELASISYIETEIKADKLEFICTDGKQISAPNFGVETIKKYANPSGQIILSYKNLNGDNKESYDNYSSFASKNAMTQVGISKDKYPKILVEELYVEGVPCATFNYNHILSASYHDVSVLGTDKEKDILFHSNPTAVAEVAETFKEKMNELCRKAFSAKAYKDKIDRKNEMFLMVHMAKADGVVEEQEKKYLAKTITGLHGFSNKEKAELFGLMSASTLPTITPTNAYFSSKTRVEEAKKKIIELVAKADGEYEPQEKAKLEEINKAIEAGYKAKPSAIGQFFKTWQVSLPIITSFLTIIGLTTYFLFFATKINANEELNTNPITTNSNTTSKVVVEAPSIANTPIVQEQKDTTATAVEENTAISENKSDLVGEWKGAFGKDQLILSIESINDDGSVTGFNIVKNNKRALTGFKTGEEFELKEPGDDKWDGVFKFTIKEGEAKGTWVANNGKSTKQFILNKN